MVNYTQKEFDKVINWLQQNGHFNFSKEDVNALIRVERKFKILNLDVISNNEVAVCLHENKCERYRNNNCEPAECGIFSPKQTDC